VERTTDEERDHFPRLYFLENADPDSTHELLARLDLRRTLFNVISKSGGTSETLAQLQIIEDRLNTAVGNDAARGHLIFTTDPEQGELRRLSNEKGIPALPVPPNVGGRFSVLSPVGLLPAAITGIDIESLLAGAGRNGGQVPGRPTDGEPAGMLATLLHAADDELGCSTHVLMPYADRLQTASLWFQQLWAESLGKRQIDPADLTASQEAEGPDRAAHGVGPTPLAALGAVDQHSLLQLLMEGPADKVVVFVRIRTREIALPIPGLHPEYAALSLLGGHTLEELLDVERRATTEALRKAGRPSLTLEMERLDARSFGAFLMLFQVATVIAGELYGVNPLDQPGVELSKILTRQILSGDGSPIADDDADDGDWWV
jgi:glucose-6-phosphate isomerase